jgi:hypothetical protein
VSQDGFSGVDPISGSQFERFVTVTFYHLLHRIKNLKIFNFALEHGRPKNLEILKKE